MTGKPVELPAEALRRVCDPDSFDFETTATLPTLSEVLGQPRAVAALEFGASIASHGFNLFAMGLPGSGKTTLIREYLERLAPSQPVPPDLVYVHNFASERKPIPIHLPAGMARGLKEAIDALIGELKAAIPRAFDSAEYTALRDKIVQGLDDKRRDELGQLEQRVTKGGFQLLKGPSGIMLVPSVAGKPLTQADLETLTPDEREKVARVLEKLQKEVEERVRVIREQEKAARDALRALDTETARYAVRHIIDDLRAQYRDHPAVLEYLDALESDVVENADDFRKSKEPEAPQVPVPLPPGAGERTFVRYQVNILVDNAELKGAPVIVETNPTFYNLTGRIEHQAVWGGVLTDHTMIKPGALHRANGGYLIIPARECLISPAAWEGLKRALKDRCLRIEELGVHLSLVSTVTLDPQPVPLNIKVVLIGSPAIYYLLQAYDEDFQKLFKVKAEFTTRMNRTPESERAYALFVRTITEEEKARPFDRGAVARIVEYGSRAAEDQDQLSTCFGDIADLIREAAHRAGQNTHQAVTATDVRLAEEARRFRQNLVEERMQEAILRGTVLLETAGTAVGRINGLSVLNVGDYMFGQPARITATVGPGRRGVVSIEREVELSGPIHGKGVLILSGYLLRKYGATGPLSVSASLVFEQSYGMIDGDSASLAELCVLLSAVSGIPLRQDVAITGSVNQHGHVQAVGGVTEKIEGFFAVCRSRGFTGTQGVITPSSNQHHLMLGDEVLEAVRDGQFHIWVVQEVDEALALLTGSVPGDPGDDGIYPEGTVHRAVFDRLAEYESVLREHLGSEGKQEA